MDNTNNLPKFGSYQPIVKAGNTYYISGQIGVDVITMEAPRSVISQTKLVLANLRVALKSLGLDYKDLTKTTIYLVNIDDFNTVNNLYSKILPDPKPARTTVGVKDLPKVGGNNKILIEIDAIAYKEETNNE